MSYVQFSINFQYFFSLISIYMKGHLGHCARVGARSKIVLIGHSQGFSDFQFKISYLILFCRSF